MPVNKVKYVVPYDICFLQVHVDLNFLLGFQHVPSILCSSTHTDRHHGKLPAAPLSISVDWQTDIM